MHSNGSGVSSIQTAWAEASKLREQVCMADADERRLPLGWDLKGATMSPEHQSPVRPRRTHGSGRPRVRTGTTRARE